MAMDGAGEKCLWQQFSNFLLVCRGKHSLCLHIIRKTAKGHFPPTKARSAKPWDGGRCPLQGWAIPSGHLHSVLCVTWDRLSSITLSCPGILPGPCSETRTWWICHNWIYSGVCSRDELWVACIAFFDWILTLTKAQKSSATDSKEEQQFHSVSLCFCFAILLDSFSGPHLMGAIVSPSVLLSQSFSCHTSCTPQDCSSIMNRGILWKRKSG